MDPAVCLSDPLGSSFLPRADQVDSGQPSSSLRLPTLHQQHRNRIHTRAENAPGMRRRHFRRREEAENEKKRAQETPHGRPRDRRGRRSEVVKTDSLSSAWARVASSISPALDELKQHARCVAMDCTNPSCALKSFQKRFQEYLVFSSKFVFLLAWRMLL